MDVELYSLFSADFDSHHTQRSTHLPDGSMTLIFPMTIRANTVEKSTIRAQNQRVSL